MSDSPTTTTPVVHPVTGHAQPDIQGHILIADPNEQSRDRRRSKLRDFGYNVTVARTSFETIVKACCHVPDLVLLDGALGDIEVAETARLLATCPVTAHIPVVRLGTGRRLLQRVLTHLRRVAV
jgi:CheY-like chemotaxis protein